MQWNADTFYRSHSICQQFLPRCRYNKRSKFTLNIPIERKTNGGKRIKRHYFGHMRTDKAYLHKAVIEEMEMMKNIKTI